MSSGLSLLLGAAHVWDALPGVGGDNDGPMPQLRKVETRVEETK